MKPMILIVDDEPSIRTALMRLMASQGFMILTASNSREALETVNKLRVDVVICDERMPGMTGSRLLQHLKRSHPNTVRILLTGHADIHAVASAVNQGEIFRFYTKPWDDDMLMEGIREGLSRVASNTGRDFKPTPTTEDFREAFRRSHPELTTVDRSPTGTVFLLKKDNSSDCQKDG